MSKKTYRGIRIETESVYLSFSAETILTELEDIKEHYGHNIDNYKKFILRVLLYGYFDSQNELRTTINGKSK